jgi:gliding motility-associated-like protein
MKHFITLLTILFLSFTSFSQCGGDITFDLSIPPTPDATYPPNTIVELCVTMTNWNGNAQGSNWLEGFGLTLGSGWVTVNPTLPPNDAGADASGTWLWVNSVTSDATGLTAGPGYFFEGPTGPTDGNPGNDWGDFCLNGDCVWTFCVELTSSGNSGDPLDVEVQNYADGTMGSWGNNDCEGQDPPVVIFDGVVGCNTYGCTNPIACNYDANAACDDGSCELPGCTDPVACNYNPNAPCDDGSCTYGGCTDPAACNFNPLAGCDDGSCSYFSMGNITHNLIPCPDTVCTGLDVIYSVNGSQSSNYIWSVNGGGVLDGSQTASTQIHWGDTPGVYTISVQEITSAGCLGELETCDVKVVVPDISFDSSYKICYNQFVELSASPVGGIWSGEHVNGNVFYGNFPGVFWPSYTQNIFGCDITESIDVTVEPVYDSPEIIYTKLNLDLCTDQEEQLYIADDNRTETFVWTIDNVLQPTNHNILLVNWYDTTNTYLINVYGIDNLGCQSSVFGINIHTESCQVFYAPNSFTPNGDGVNDVFKITSWGIYETKLKIFNRWGVIIHESPHLWWTGDGGSGYYSDDDIYTWIVEYKDRNGFHKTEQGIVTLIR